MKKLIESVLLEGNTPAYMKGVMKISKDVEAARKAANKKEAAELEKAQKEVAEYVKDMWNLDGKVIVEIYRDMGDRFSINIKSMDNSSFVDIDFKDLASWLGARLIKSESRAGRFNASFYLDLE